MRFRPIALVGLAGLLIEAQALAETCNVQVTGPADQWKFVHVYDVATGEIVLRQAIKSGESKPVTVSGDKVRVDWKLPGYQKYRTGPVVECKSGNTVKT
jgi:hypothetical protein